MHHAMPGLSGRGHRPCHSAALILVRPEGPKPPASARPAHGGRFPPAGSGAGLCVSRTCRSPGHCPTPGGQPLSPDRQECPVGQAAGRLPQRPVSAGLDGQGHAQKRRGRKRPPAKACRTGGLRLGCAERPYRVRPPSRRWRNRSVRGRGPPGFGPICAAGLHVSQPFATVGDKTGGLAGRVAHSCCVHCQDCGL